MNIEKLVQLNAQTAGRDKIARLVQYASRAIYDSLEQSRRSPNMVENFKTLEYILSTFRKLLRFGRSLDVFYSSLRTIHYPDLIIRVTLTLSRLSQSLFLFADHVMWLARTGLFTSISTKKWAQLANKYWLFSIIMNLCRDFYEVVRIIDLHRASVKSGISRSYTVPHKPKEIGHFLCSLAHIHRDVLVDTVKNACDFFIPFTALGYTTLSPRSIGILGGISSIAGLIALIEPTAKLTPA